MLDAGDANVPQYISNLTSVLKDEACDIEHIVVSHWHHDHIGGVPEVLKLAGPGILFENLIELFTLLCLELACSNKIIELKCCKYFKNCRVFYKHFSYK